MSGIRSLSAIELRLKNFVAAAAAAEQKSCFDEAENRAASSLWVGDHRYTRISCMSKLLWVYSHLKSDFFFREQFAKFDLALEAVIKNRSNVV